MKEKNESKKKPIAILLLLIQRLLLMTVAMHPLQHLLYCFGLNPCDHCQTSMAALTPGDSHTTSYTDQQPRLLVGGNPADKKQQHVNKREGVRMHGKGKKKKTKLSVCPRLICPAETTLISHLLRGYQVANNPSAGCWEDKALAQQMHPSAVQEALQENALIHKRLFLLQKRISQRAWICSFQRSGLVLTLSNI